MKFYVHRWAGLVAIFCWTYCLVGMQANSLQIVATFAYDNPRVFEKFVNKNNMNIPDDEGRTPLLLAAEFNYPNYGMLLVGMGAEVNVQSTISGNSPLHWAVRNSNFEFAKLLCTKGAKLGCKNKMLYTPLHIAVGFGSFELAEFLVGQKDSGINEKDIYGRIPLHLAVLRVDFGLIKLLIGHGSVLDCGDINGDTPLHLAMQVGKGALLNSPEVFEKLVNNSNINVPGEGGRTPLLLAAEFNYAQLGAQLVEKGAKVNVQSTISGDSPLHWAVRNSNFEFAKYLYAKGAMVGCKNKMLETPLHIAVELKLLDLAEFLVEQKNNGINEKDVYGRMPLHWAVLAGDLAMVKLLVEHGAALDCGDMNGDTLLHLTAHVDNGVLLAKYLIGKGAAFLAKNKRGDTPLHSAAGWNNAGVVEELIAAGADVTVQNTYKQTPLHEAILYKYRGTVSFMQSQNSTDKDGCQLGYWPDEDKNHVKIVSMLLKKNPKITTIADNTGVLPVQLAMQKGAPGVVAYLALAADPVALPNNKSLLVADGNELWSITDEKVGECLDTKGRSALWWAIEKGDLALVKFFAKNGLSPQLVQNEMAHAQKNKQLTIAAYLGFVADYLGMDGQKGTFSEFAKKYLIGSGEQKVQQIQSDLSELACQPPVNKLVIEQLRLWNKGNIYLLHDSRLKAPEWIYLSYAAAATSFNQKLKWLEYCFAEFKPKGSGLLEKKFCDELKKYVFYLGKTLPVTENKKCGKECREKTRSNELEAMCKLHMSTDNLGPTVKLYEQSLKNNLNLKQ